MKPSYRYLKGARREREIVNGTMQGVELNRICSGGK